MSEKTASEHPIYFVKPHTLEINLIEDKVVESSPDLDFNQKQALRKGYCSCEIQA